MPAIELRRWRGHSCLPRRDSSRRSVNRPFRAARVSKRFFLLFTATLALADDSLTKGLQAFQAGRYADARQLFEKSTDADAPAFLALVEAATGGCKEAMQRLTVTFSSAADATLRKLAGEALLSCVESSLKADYPADADVLYQSARVHMKAWNDAVYQMFQKTPGSYRVNQISGEILEIQGKYPEAAAEYRKAIEKNPRALDLHFRLGRVLLIDSQGPEALETARREFEAELGLNAGDAAAEYEVGQILIAQGKREAGVSRLEHALALRPDFVEALLAVGKARLDAKRYHEAVALLESAVKLQPRSEPAHYNLMMAYRNSGDVEAAKREKQALDALQKPPEGEFTEFLKKLGEKPPKP
jgi:tetratricopeptide (TPR) repeat protein